ncbi:MAG: retention module-containing protein, partial [Aeromonas sp.]
MTAGSFTLHNDTTVTELKGSLFLVMNDGSRRLVEEGEVLAQGAVIFSLDSTSFMANGQRFEWVSGELDITKNDVTKSTESSSQVTFEHESHANHSSALTFKALADEISVLQNDIMKDVDAPADLVVAAAGGEDVGGVINGSGNGGYVTILRDGDATIASAGFETRDLAESFMAGNDREFAQDGAGVIWDVTAPTITVVVPENTNDTTPTISGQTDAAPGSTITIVVTDSAGHKHDLTTTVKPDGSYSVEVTTPLPEGSFNVDASVSDPAGNTNDATGSGIVDVTAPVNLSIALDPNITPDDVINAAEARTDIPVSGTVSGEFNEGDTVTLTVNNKQFTGTVDADGRFTINVAGSDLVADPSHIIDASVTSTDAAGNTDTATTTEDYKVDLEVSDLAIELDPNITPDDVINAVEAGENIPVSGTVTGEFNEGDTVILTVNDKQFTGKVDANGRFTVDVAGSDLAADPHHSINASVTSTDAAGNTDSASTTETYKVDLEESGLAIKLDGNITADDVINATEAGQKIPVSGIVTGEFSVGDTVTLTVNDKLYFGTVDADGRFIIDVKGSDLAADLHQIIDARVIGTDAAGNIGSATTAEGYGVDIKLPSISVIVPEQTNDTTPTITGQTDAAPGSTVTIVVTDSAGISQTLTTTVHADGSYSVDVVTPLPEGDFTANATVNDPAGNQGNAFDDGIVDVTAPAGLTIVLDPNITADDIINSAEAAGHVMVSGTVAGGEFEAGDVVTLTI